MRDVLGVGRAAEEPAGEVMGRVEVREDCVLEAGEIEGVGHPVIRLSEWGFYSRKFEGE